MNRDDDHLDTFYSVLFALCSASGAAWFYVDVVVPMLSGW